MKNALAMFGDALGQGLSGAAQIFAPEEYNYFKGQRDAKNYKAKLGNALAGGNYGAASQAAFEFGDIGTGMQLKDYQRRMIAEQDELTRQQELQGLQRELAYLQNVAQTSDPALTIRNDPNFAQLFDDVNPVKLAEMIEAHRMDPKNNPDALGDLILMAQAEMGQAPAAPGKPGEGQFTLGNTRYNPDGSIVAEGAPEQVQMLTPEQEIEVFGSDLPGNFQRKPDGSVSQISGTAPQGGGIFGDGGFSVTTADGTRVQLGGAEGLAYDKENQPVLTPDEQQQYYSKMIGSLESFEVQNNVVLTDIDRAIGMADGWTTGLFGGASQFVWGTPAFDLAKTLDSIKANIGFDKLQDMRDNSPTGGALGQVSEWELVLLQSVLGSLEQAQSKEQFVYYLNRIKEIKQEAAVMRRQAFARDFPDIFTAQQRATNTNQALDEALSRYD